MSQNGRAHCGFHLVWILSVAAAACVWAADAPAQPPNPPQNGQGGDKEQAQAERNRYIAQMQQAWCGLNRPYAGTIEDTLEQWIPEAGQPDHRGWEWYALLSQTQEKLVWTLYDHIQPVRHVDWANDGRRFMSLGDDGVVRIWDVTNGQELAQLAKVDVNPSCVAWARSGAVIATGHQDGTIRLWDGNSYELKATLEQHGANAGGDASIPSVAFSSDARRLATYGRDQTVKIWNVDTAELMRSVMINPAPPTEPPADAEAKTDAAVPTEPEAKTDGDAAAEPEAKSDPVVPDDPPFQVAMNGDGSRFVNLSDRACKVWDTDSGNLVIAIWDQGLMGRCMALSPDGAQIAIAGTFNPYPYHDVYIFDVYSSVPLRRLHGHLEATQAIDWDSTGRRIVTAGRDHTVRVWNADDGQQLAVLQGHSGHVYDVRFSTDNRFIVSGSGDGTVRVWHAETGKPARSHVANSSSGMTCVAWSPDSTKFAYGGWDNLVHVWDVVARKPLCRFTGHTAAVQGIAWSPDGRLVASASGDQSARVWDVATSQQVLAITGHEAPLEDVAWSPDGTQLATASDGKGIRIWDAKSGQQLHEFQAHGARVNAVQWSPDGKYLGCTSPGGLRNWEVATAQTVTDRGFGDWINAHAFAFARDGSAFAFNFGPEVIVCSFPQFDKFTTLRGHTADVLSVSWNEDGSRLVTACYDGTVRLWDVATGTQIATLAEDAATAFNAAWSPLGRAIAAVGHDGSVRLWDADTGYDLVDDPTFLAGQTVRRYQRAQILTLQGEHDQAAQLFAEVLAWKPDHTGIMWEQSAAYARMGDWKTAADGLSRISGLQPKDRFAGVAWAMLLLWGEDVDGYRRVCTQLLQMVKETSAPDDPAPFVAWILLIGQPHSQDLPDAQALIDRSYEAAKTAPGMQWFVRIVDQRRNIATPTPQPADGMYSPLMEAQDCLLESIRLLHLQQTDEARKLYDHGRQILDSKHDKMTGDDWWFVAPCTILSREFEQAVK